MMWGKNTINNNLVKYTIGVILLIIIATNLGHKRYNQPDRVIEWDIKSYYAYLPSVFIYQDLSLQFRENNMEKWGSLMWPSISPTGEKIIITSMGMSFLYTPFFLMAHTVATLSHWESDGYSKPYRFALTFSAFFYIWLGLIFSARILRRFYDERVIALTLLAVVLGTNLLYYSTYEAPMSHAYNFALIAVFLWQIIRFYENPTIWKIILAGAMAGLITLVRPTNILVLFLFFLWDIKSTKDFKERVQFFLYRYYWILIMAGVFLLVWLPQFVYWHNMAGSFFYFSYGAKGDKFYFFNPQIFNILFSYKKGWFVYTPLMFLAFIGLFFLPEKLKGFVFPFAVFKILNIYILSSWWSWWFGGGFGLRAFIDSYAIMMIPLGAILSYAFKGQIFRRLLIFAAISFLIFLNVFQTWQYTKNMIHYDSMNKETYWKHFLRTKPAPDYWQIIEKQRAIEREERERIKNK